MTTVDGHAKRALDRAYASHVDNYRVMSNLRPESEHFISHRRGMRRSGFISESSVVSRCKKCKLTIYVWEYSTWCRGEFLGLCHVNCPDRTTPQIVEKKEEK